MSLAGSELLVQCIEPASQIGIVARLALGLGAPLLIAGIIAMVVEEISRSWASQVAEQRPEEQPVPDTEAPLAVRIGGRRRPGSLLVPLRPVRLRDRRAGNGRPPIGVGRRSS